MTPFTVANNEFIGAATADSAATAQSNGPAIMVPDAVPGRVVRRRRRSDDVVAEDAVPSPAEAAVDEPESKTMAPEGALGMSTVPSEPRSARRRPGKIEEGSVTSLPAPGSTGPGRSETATR